MDNRQGEMEISSLPHVQPVAYPGFHCGRINLTRHRSGYIFLRLGTCCTWCPVCLRHNAWQFGGISPFIPPLCTPLRHPLLERLLPLRRQRHVSPSWTAIRWSLSLTWSVCLGCYPTSSSVLIRCLRGYSQVALQHDADHSHQPDQLVSPLRYLPIGGFGEQNRGRVVRCWPPTNSLLVLGLLPLCHFGENRLRNATVRVHTDRQTETDRQTDTRCDRDKLDL